MKGLTVAVLASVLASTCSAFNFRRSLKPRVVHFNIRRESAPSGRFSRRGSSTLPLKESSDGSYYKADVSIGTPPQTISIQLDTGSSDFLINSATAPLCAEKNLCADGSYKANGSSTYQYINSFFGVSYGDGTYGYGDFVTDNLIIGNATVTNFTMGVTYNTTTQQNVWGIGYPKLENGGRGLVDGAPSPPSYYPNVAFQMVNDSLITTPTYSLWLNDRATGTGSILFGGVDSAKYIPPLAIVPVVPNNGVFNRLLVTLNAIGTHRGQQATLTTPSGFPITVLLDSGSTSTLLPPQIVTNIYNAFGVTPPSDPTRSGSCDCKLQDPAAGTISFSFSGLNISVPVSEFVRTTPGASTCSFDLSVGGSDPLLTQWILGDSFLRSAYVVFDLGNDRIGLAQTKFNTTDSNVLEIVSNDTYPGAVPASAVQTGVPSGSGPFQPAVTQGSGGVHIQVAGSLLAGLAAGFLFCML